MANRVAYFYDDSIGDIYYGQGHPMKPQRVKMTHALINEYGLSQHLNVFRPHLALYEEMTQYHFPDYVKALSTATPRSGIVEELGDCPIFEGLYNLCQVSAGSSIDCAAAINQGFADIAINWSGGLHHAKRKESSGFWYVNDIVLAIIELLKYHQRVLYIDIDVHHGDGVEEAFYNTNRVMTLSFHKYGKFFPGTGGIDDVGVEKGMYHSLNVTLRSGITDEQFIELFKPIMSSVKDHFRPEAIVLQCGADSLAYDKIGRFNLTINGHGDCVAYVKSLGIPMIVLGGGGYTIANVARCWVNETAICLDKTLPDDIPLNDYYTSYGPFYKLYFEPDPRVENKNSKEMLQQVMTHVLQNLKQLEGVPSVAMHDRPADLVPEELLKSSWTKPTHKEFFD